MTDWRQLLRDEVEKANEGRGRGGIAKVAVKLDVSRTAVSLLLAGKYPGSTEYMAHRIEFVFGSGEIQCPHLQAAIPIRTCESWRTRPMPRSNPVTLRHWSACRTCPVGKALAAGRLPDPANAATQPGEAK